MEINSLKDFVLLIKDLPKTKGGVFVIGVLVSIVPAVVVYQIQVSVFTGQIKNHERELNRYAKTEELLNRRLDSCDAKAERAYLKGIEENINKDLMPVKAYQEAVNNIKQNMQDEEKQILNNIEKKQAAIKKEMEVEI